jgi:predicted protein tyrosine phosphatase
MRDAQGKMLVHCHAGCEQAAMLAALKALGLWSKPRQSAETRPR